MRRYYQLRGYRILDANAWVGGYELDLVVRRGGRISFVEVKAKGDGRYGDPLEMVGPEKERRMRWAAEGWLAAHSECLELEVVLEVVAVRGPEIERLQEPF